MKNEIVISIKRFEAKQEVKVLTALNRILKAEADPMSEEQAIADLEAGGIMSLCGCVMVIPLTEQAKRICSRFVDRERSRSIKNIPSLSYTQNSTLEVKALFNIKFLEIALDLLKASTSTEDIKKDKLQATVQVLQDYPITISNNHFKVIIAPRMG